MYRVKFEFNNTGLFQLLGQIRDASDEAKMSMIVASSLIGVVRKRIHVDGIASNGKPIGTYSDKYMKVRTGMYPNVGVFKSGAKKGQSRKPAGVFTKGARVGQKRPVYNRSSDTKVIASLTRAGNLESSYTIVAVTNSIYGIGFTNELAYDKTQWVTSTYRDRIKSNKVDAIFELTKEEENLTELFIYEYLKNAIS